MNMRLEDQIRHYTESLDTMAPAVESLLPEGMADELGLEAPRLQLVATVTPPPRRAASGWLIGLAAAAVAAIMLIPLALWLGDVGTDPIDASTTTTIVTTTTEPPPATSTTSVAPQPPAAGPGLVFHLPDRTLSGSGFAPDSQITVTHGSDVTTGRTDSAGSFELPPGGAFPECCFEPLVVTDGTTTHRVDIPHLELTRIDVATDVVTGLVGNAEGGVPELLRLAVGTGPERHETILEPADIVEAGFGIDFTGILDIREGTVVETSASFPGITLLETSMPFVDPSLAIWPHTGSGETAPWNPDENSIALGGLEPDAELRVTIDGIAVPGAYRVNPTGRFSLELDDVGMTIDLGSELVIQSGTDELRYVVPFLTFEQFDAAAGTASGRVDMEPGTPLWIEMWFGPGDGTEATGYFTAAPRVDDERWSLSFPPLPSGETVLRATVGLGNNREITQVNFGFE